jgi:hypothetical protein
VAKPFADKNWLAALVAEALRSHEAGVEKPRPADPGAAQRLDFAAAARLVVARSLRARRPPLAPASEVEGFLEIVQRDVLLLLDLLLLAPVPIAPDGAQAEVAAFLAAALGEERLALEALHGATAKARERAVARAWVVAGAELRARFFPPGDPRNGLPLSSGATAVFRRHLARIVGGYARGGALEPEALRRHAEYADRELALLAEALAGLLRTTSAPGRREAWVRRRQMARLGLRAGILREARARVAAPRSPEELAQAELSAPEPLRAFLFEQLLLAQLRARLPGEGPARFVEGYAHAAQLDPQVVVAAQVEAAAQSGDPQAWFEEFDGPGGALDWHELADDVGTAAEKVASAVTQNLGALKTELRETGELGSLLTKAAAGHRLSADEKRKVRAQLIDLAKAVPALALFAAPGGSILLPLLVKLLPFNLLPSAWENVGAPPAPGGSAATGEVAGAAGGAEAEAEPATAGPVRTPKPAA